LWDLNNIDKLAPVIGITSKLQPGIIPYSLIPSKKGSLASKDKVHVKLPPSELMPVYGAGI
jgi:hypothetical protein